MGWKNIVDAFQGWTREVELGSHTIKSHGAAVARNHMHDWLILLLLVIIEVLLNIIHPFYLFVGKDMMTDLRYPMKDNTVPIWAVPMYAVLLPIVVFNLFYIRRRSVYDLHHSILGLLFAVLITGVLTDSIKNGVGRPRPDFFWRCFPDGKRRSFAGLGFLSLYLSGKIKAYDHRGHVSKLCIVFLPLLVASLVGVSRVDDYLHHWQDVFAGGLLGLVVATFCYLQFFPAPHHTKCWNPYAHFQALEELHTNSQLTPPLNGMEVQAEFEALSIGLNSSSRPDDMESGRM